MLERERHATTGELVRRTVRPFDEHQRSSAEDLVPRERLELVRAFQPIQVEMIDRRPRSVVFLDERECRAGDLAGHAVALADRLNERGLARTQLAREGD